MDLINISYYKAFFNTPSLWTGELDGLKQFDFPEIYFENLAMGSIPSNVRLGHKIEHIFLKLIQHSRQYKVIGHNIPIRKEKVSLGEIDFLLQDIDSKQFIHIELTYKFYVVPEVGTNMPLHLIGPNQRDSFKAKKERIINHQIPLLKTSEATSVLHRLHINPEELVHRVCFKSQLFIPFLVNNWDVAPFNPSCISGRWVPFHKFNSLEFFEHRYYLPTKPEWLLNPHNEVNWLRHSDILDVVTIQLKKRNSPLIWMKSSDFNMVKLFVLWW
ncbi:DUF1853 family protein [Arenibacter troitsensis]|uniref:DUF1853 domain-containing protein n=1 Tax=Arenibacter troitsensis TaxID=188872 RepID=A0A1X7JAF2_9FLAO|nr:DUF1853 family protein [Arenibacter troitsensis]SMG24686.1 hypothetical protein SAMN03080602_01572 [Arenibacter troitsensis]